MAGKSNDAENHHDSKNRPRVSFSPHQLMAEAAPQEPPTNDDNDNYKSALGWQLASCYLAFTFTYVVTNIAPYGPFMVLDLLPGRVTADSVGRYSSFFTSCHIWGRQSTASWWGHLADRRGRLPVVYCSLLSAALFTLLFGLSTNYFVALAIRFLLGLCGDGGSVLKVVVSEMAGDDFNLEARSMNMGISAWAVATLLAPAIGGALSNPVEQYPNLQCWQSYPLLTNMLTTYRYVLPNLVGTVLCLVGCVVVRLHLKETLTGAFAKEDEQQRSLTRDYHVGTEQQPLLLNAPTTAIDFNASFEISPEAFEMAQERNLERTMRDSYFYSNDFEGLMTNERTRKSVAMSLYRRSTKRTNHCRHLHVPEEDAENVAPRTEAASSDQDSPTKYSTLSNIMKAVMEMPTMVYFLDTDIRNHIVVLCVGCFVTAFHMEAFPLFCLNQKDGLGISENTIGAVMLASGVAHTLIQPSLYGYVFARTGLRGSVRWAAVALVPVFFVIPCSLWSKGRGTDHLRWTALMFLGVVVGLGRMFTVTFYSSLFVSLNHLVAPDKRGAFNGLITKISNGCRSTAPIMAGFFTAWAFTSPGVSDGWGGTILYVTLGVAGIGLSAAAHLLLGPEDFL